MRFMCVAFLYALTVVPMGAFRAAAAEQDNDATATRLLWEIGVADGTGSEFALAPGRFREYLHDGFFYVGLSKPERDWPYAHPGPRDPWAGGRRHTFTILFALEEASASGECRLDCKLVDAHAGAPPALRIEVNGHPYDRGLEAGAGDRSIEGTPGAGRAQQFSVSFPAQVLHQGDNRIDITTAAGSWFLYDWMGLYAAPGTKLMETVTPRTEIESARSLPVLYAGQNGLTEQGVRLSIRHIGEPCKAELQVMDAEPIAVTLAHGVQVVDARCPSVTTDTAAAVRIAIGGAVVAERDVDLKPVRKWIMYLLHHTHLDIGYTHPQAEVEAIQWRHLQQALDLIDQTSEYPQGSKFKWLPEGLWAVDSYLKQASEEDRQRFIRAVQNGGIGLDALYGNELTALCRPEELIELTQYARQLRQRYGVSIDSAMISDVPGYTWGLVPALAESGFHYISFGPNAGHRIGGTLAAWGDRPFSWVSPSGNEKVLCWMAAKAYSWFHGAPLRDDQKLLDYLAALEDSRYPYDMVQVRYNIGGDNGPPDPEISNFVKSWNERYAYPKLILATTSEMFRAFEKAYADSIPEARGDFTPYWEDGAGSSAQETAINRASAERLVQAHILWSMLNSRSYPEEAFEAAWRNVLLYDEHTWGAHNSITEPESEFARQQWEVKQAFALDGERQSIELLDGALQPYEQSGTDEVQALLVFNTLSWPRTGLVVWPASRPRAGDRVEDASGAPVPSQCLSNGDLAFLAAAIPPFGAARYALHDGEPYHDESSRAEGNTLSNGLLSVIVNEQTGAIQSLIPHGDNTEFVDTAGGMGLNEYFYVPGRDPKASQRNGRVSIRTGEPGPLVSSLIVESGAPGCRALTREIRLVAGLDHVDLINVVDKEKVYTPEAVHFAFPFKVPEGTVRMDTPWAVVRPEADQLPGACKNYFTVQRWADVSSDGHGITWATVDAPLVEIGAITCDPRVVGWIESLKPSTTLYSYVMNNYWETNYKAAQDGPTVFRYSLRPHGAYDQAEAQCFGVECSQPLIAAPVGVNTPSIAPRLSIDHPGIMVTSIRPSRDRAGWIIRLFNGTASAAETQLQWPEGAPGALWRSDLDEQTKEKVTGPIPMAPYAIITLRADNPAGLPGNSGPPK